MDKFIVTGKNTLKGTTKVSGAKNVALKALVAACLTNEEVTIENVPLISDFYVMLDIIKELGGSVNLSGHTLKISMKDFATTKISLDRAANIRTSVMFLAPLLARKGEATIPNPGGCRIGARPIDRTVEGLKKMGVDINYFSEDGYFHGKILGDKIQAAEYTFEKNTHTGTETLILAAVMADGKTVLHNSAEEPEVDELIEFLNKMGADIKRTSQRVIEINGVSSLHGTTFTISPDRNEIVTLAIGAIITKGDITIENGQKAELNDFLEKFEQANGGVEKQESAIRFFYNGPIKAVDVTTSPSPGFMTDWQGPWAIFMTQAEGTSVIHEAVYENRFGYVSELKKMGAKIELFNPEVTDPKSFYNFNLNDDQNYFHAAKITGPIALHDGVVNITDLRAGATLVLAALAATGTSTIYGIGHLDRGYEKFEERLTKLGADIKRESDE